ncbi:SDR family NAD(P)-dependent oxidoreductase [Nocardia sp. KC 131]|uniref:SDR family NAD(P)-dependent oxidoreductase n=1 Tax=Nocardia arseniciresistens TaxID=3392119 RepID=UPI00398EE664
MPNRSPKIVIISGGTSGMGRATALERLARGDIVIVIGSDESKGNALIAQAANTNLRFVKADLSSIAELRRVATLVAEQHDTVDALALFANRLSPTRRVTADGLEYTFALYYLSRYLLADYLRPLLDRSSDPVIINVAGVGNTAGGIEWGDPQLSRRYRLIRAQLQAGRANDLAGVAFAERASSKARYVLYHPGFTRSGGDQHPNPLVRNIIKVLARFFARRVADSIRPIVGWIDQPPSAPLSAIDRGRPVDPSLRTLDRADAARLVAYTEDLLTTGVG